MSKRTIELSHDARDDWRSIWDHGIKRWSPIRTDAYYSRIADRMDALALGDMIGFPVQSYPGLLKSPIGSHIIYFRLSPTELRVVRILHHRMDVESRL